MHFKKVIVYQTESGKEPFTEWLDKRDTATKIRISKRIAMIKKGNLGDCKALGSSVYELRLFFGPGYRVYFGIQEHTVIVILCGGDKSSQEKDIKRAVGYWREIQYEKHENISRVQH